MFAMWDAYRDAEGEINPYSYIPFVFGAFFITIGLIFSTKLKIMGVVLGPVILPTFFSTRSNDRIYYLSHCSNNEL
jgi:hypothetical protein